MAKKKSTKKKAKEINPSKLNLNYHCAILNIKNRDYDDAINSLSKLIEIKSDDCKLYILRAECRKKLKDHIGCINDYSKIININPKNPFSANTCI